MKCVCQPLCLFFPCFWKEVPFLAVAFLIAQMVPILTLALRCSSQPQLITTKQTYQKPNADADRYDSAPSFVMILHHLLLSSLSIYLPFLLEWKCRIQNALCLLEWKWRIQNASDDFLFPGDLSSICGISLYIAYGSSGRHVPAPLALCFRCGGALDFFWQMWPDCSCERYSLPPQAEAVVSSLRNVPPFRAHANCDGFRCLSIPAFFSPQIVGRFTSWVLPSPLHLPFFHQTWFAW